MFQFMDVQLLFRFGHLMGSSQRLTKGPFNIGIGNYPPKGG